MRAGVGGEEEVEMEAGEVEGVGGEVKGGRLVGEEVPLMLATWMRFWLLPSRVSCVLLCPFGHLGNLTVAYWVSFDFNVFYSSA